MKPKFKREYVLGEGYPWAYGTERTKYFQAGVNIKSQGVDAIPLEWPDELWRRDLPKFKLILRRVK